jgi:hypothetical protein
MQLPLLFAVEERYSCAVCPDDVDQASFPPFEVPGA